MLLKLLGAIDIIASIALLLLKFGIGETMGLILGIILLVKGLIFFSGFTGVMDLLSGLLLVLASFGLFYGIYLLFALWLLQKGFFSLVSS